MKNRIFGKCGSDKIIDDIQIIDHGHAGIKRKLSFKIPIKGGMFKRSIQGAILPRLCGSCGNIELYVDDFQAIWNKYHDKL